MIDTSPEETSRKPQLSKKALQEMIRPHVPDLIEKTLMIIDNGDNDNARLGAIKLLLAKVLPDLKATELSGELAVDVRNVLRLPAKRPLDTPPKTD